MSELSSVTPIFYGRNRERGEIKKDLPICFSKFDLKRSVRQIYDFRHGNLGFRYGNLGFRHGSLGFRHGNLGFRRGI